MTKPELKQLLKPLLDSGVLTADVAIEIAYQAGYQEADSTRAARDRMAMLQQQTHGSGGNR